MNQEQQLEVNMKAAMLYSKTKPLTRRGKCYVSMNPFEAMYTSIELEVDNVLYREFNIFTNAQDLLDVVKGLGKAHGIGIDYYDFSGEDTTLKSGWGYTENHADSGVFKVEFNTYEEAVAEAVIEVSDER